VGLETKVDTEVDGSSVNEDERGKDADEEEVAAAGTVPELADALQTIRPILSLRWN
jgi:hypothetical protein